MHLRTVAGLLVLAFAPLACGDDPCGEISQSYELSSVEVRVDSGSAGPTLSVCGWLCADVEGNLYQRFQFDEVVATLPPDAVRATTFVLDDDPTVFFCGDGGQVWSASAAAPVDTWTQVPTGVDTDFTAAGSSGGFERCVSREGSLLLDGAPVWVEHEPYPSSPKSIVAGEGASFVHLQDGSMWRVDADSLDIEQQLFADAGGIANFAESVSGGNLFVRAVGTDGRLWTQTVNSEEPAQLVPTPHDVVAAGRALVSWTVDTEGCAWVGANFESPLASVCVENWMPGELLYAVAGDESELDAYFVLESEFSLMTTGARRVIFGAELTRCEE